MRSFTFIALLGLAVTSCTKVKEQTHLGVFSNEAEGFKIVTVMIHPDGLAYFHAAVAGQICEWDFDESAATLSLKGLDPSTMKEHTLNFRFDEKKRSYKRIKPDQTSGNDPADELHFVSAEIPNKMVEAFKVYPARLKQMQEQAAFERELKRRREEQLERERPEYERVVAQIKAEPRTVLAKEFHSQKLTELGNFPPKIRAFRDTLSGSEVTYPEEVLIELLNALPDERHTLRMLLFQRPELKGETIARFYPQALKWGKEDYTILTYIAEHPHTPMEILRDLAGRQDIAVGATQPAKDRLEKQK